MVDKLDHGNKSDGQYPSRRNDRGGVIIQIFLVLVILVAGVVVYFHLKSTAAQTKRRPPTKSVPAVQVEVLEPRDINITVEAMGTVIPARSVVLKSRVAGEVIKLHPDFSLGTVVKKDTVLLEIDPREYKLALKQQQSTVANAQYALKLEQGYQEVARREWALLGGKTNRGEDEELALRKPHLAKARAELAAAQAALEKAALDLARTRIAAPFNAVVHAKAVEIGSQVTVQAVLAELIGTDHFWIEASIPLNRLDWISIPRHPGEEGATVKITYAQGHQANGTVIRLLGKLTAEGRLARVLIAVKDPLSLAASTPDRAPLLIGEYAQVQIVGRQLEQVYAVPRLALRDNGKIWLVGEGDKLIARAIDPVWRDDRIVVLKKGLEPGARLVVSDVPGAVEGMAVKPIVNTGESPTSPVTPTTKADRRAS